MLRKGQVVAIEHGIAVVELESSSRCMSCSSVIGCGGWLQALFAVQNEIRVNLLSDQVHIGQSVHLKADDKFLLKMAILSYGVPLFAFLAGLMLAESFGMHELLSLAIGFFSVVASILVTRTSRFLPPDALTILTNR